MLQASMTPANIFAALSAIIVSSTVAVLLVWKHQMVLQGLGRVLVNIGISGGNVRRKLMSRTSFFWLVNLVFMMISAYHAAPFFGSVVSSLPGLEWLGPYIGLPVAIVIDGITIVFMQARLEANYKRDKSKASMYLWYVGASAALNTIANLYTDIEHFQAGSYSHVGPLLLLAAPVVLSIFPMFLVAIGKAADEMVNVKPLDQIDVQEYRSQEEKRVSILEAQNEFLEREAAAERTRIEIETRQKENARLRRGKTPKVTVQREFMLARLLFPRVQPVQPVQTGTTGTITREDLETMIRELREQLGQQGHTALGTMQTGAQEQLTGNIDLPEQLQENTIRHKREQGAREQSAVLQTPNVPTAQKAVRERSQQEATSSDDGNSSPTNVPVVDVEQVSQQDHERLFRAVQRLRHKGTKPSRESIIAQLREHEGTGMRTAKVQAWWNRYQEWEQQVQQADIIEGTAHQGTTMGTGDVPVHQPTKQPQGEVA